ncbi:MAG: hypothetical protein IT373_32560 [Polyangiaceae bacterium]|nr:hypothetical protein [Polyangiaceae bacterium]
MTDLTKTLLAAVATAGHWDEAAVADTLGALVAKLPGSRVDWEPGDEQWGRILTSDNQVAAILCVRFPMGVALTNLWGVNLPGGVCWVMVDDMFSPGFSVERGALEAAFGRKITDNVNLGQLSINDLWWATLS